MPADVNAAPVPLHLARVEGGAPSSGTWPPGPLVRSLVLAAVVAVLASGVLSAWLVSRASGQEMLQRLTSHDGDEVELVARMLASKIEQNQRVLGMLADGLSPDVLASGMQLRAWLEQNQPAARLFDVIAILPASGAPGVRLHAGRALVPDQQDGAERAVVSQVRASGKPVVSGPIGATPAQAYVLLAMPVFGPDGAVTAVVTGALRVQAQSLLPPSLALPARSQSRVMVFTRDGVILSHPRRERVLGHARDEPGLDAVLARQDSTALLSAPGALTLQGGYVVSWADVALPQWVVARVSDTQVLLGPLVAAQQRAWWIAGWVIAAIGLAAALALWWLMRPLAQLRRRARTVLEGGQAARLAWQPPQGTRADDEVGDVVQVFARLVELRRQQQRGNDALREQLRAVLDHAPLGIALTRGEQIELVSLQACRLLGYTPAQLLGRNLLRLVAEPPGVGNVIDAVRGDFASHGSFNGELPLMHQDGTIFWARVRGEPLHAGDPLRGVVWTLEDGTAERETRLQQDWERWHDPLTGLPNRAALERRLQVLLAERADRGPPVRAARDAGGVLLYLDVDHFTVINEVAGHNAGDDVLRHLARLLESEVRQMGWSARLGGDEFTVVLPGASVARATVVADKLRAAVAAWQPTYHERSFAIGLSIGLVPLVPGEGDAAAVLAAADMACYAAKRAGRDRVEVREVARPGEGAA